MYHVNTLLRGLGSSGVQGGVLKTQWSVGTLDTSCGVLCRGRSISAADRETLNRLRSQHCPGVPSSTQWKWWERGGESDGEHVPPKVGLSINGQLLRWQAAARAMCEAKIWRSLASRCCQTLPSTALPAEHTTTDKVTCVQQLCVQNKSSILLIRNNVTCLV